ncbi:MAG: radical SAM protein [Myxococcota bacterium]
MRVAKVLTNETCDLRCAFCSARRPHENPDVAGGSALRRRLDAQLDANPQTLVLSGGEPTLRDDLPKIVAYARARTEATLVLETHALHLDAARLRVLEAAGLDVIRIHVPALGEALDAFTGRAGAGDSLDAALTNVHASNLEYETATPIVAANLHHAASIPAALSERGLRPTTLWFGVPTSAPQASSLAPLETATVAAAGFARAAGRAGLSASIDPAAFVPPCTFAHPSAVAHTFALNPGAASRLGFAHAAGCEDCTVRERCPGLPPALHEHAKPLRAKNLRRRLTVIGTPAQQIARELVTHEVYRDRSGASLPAAIVRINFRCNQSCQFCFVSTHLPDPDEAAVRAEIEAIAAKRGALALSGGEPTLNPKLLAYIALAKDAGVAEVELQTNATRLHRDGLADALHAAGLDRAFISLHGANATTSDAITEAPGTHAQTLLGIDALASTNVALRLNYVLCEPNYREFPAFVEQVAARWPQAAVNVSFVGPSTDLVPRTRALIPRYEDVLPLVAEGMRIAAGHDLELGGFESMCGIPLCLVPGDLQRFIPLASAWAGLSESEFLKPPGCSACVLQTRCFGLRRGYAELYGTEALRPVLERSSSTDPA